MDIFTQRQTQRQTDRERDVCEEGREGRSGRKRRHGMCIEMNEREGETLLCFGFLFYMCVQVFLFLLQEGPQGKGQPWIDTKRINNKKEKGERGGI